MLNILCGLFILVSNINNQNIISKEVVNERSLESNINNKIKDSRGIGLLSAKLTIESINLSKIVIKSEQKNMQYNIDKNLIVTQNDILDNKLFLYGHYTIVDGFVLNRLNKIKIRDEIKIMYKNNKLLFNVVETGIINNVEDFYNNSTDGLYIITCTKNFDDTRFYVKAIKS